MDVCGTAGEVREAAAGAFEATTCVVLPLNNCRLRLEVVLVLECCMREGAVDGVEESPPSCVKSVKETSLDVLEVSDAFEADTLEGEVLVAWSAAARASVCVGCVLVLEVLLGVIKSVELEELAVETAEAVRTNAVHAGVSTECVLLLWGKCELTLETAVALEGAAMQENSGGGDAGGIMGIRGNPK